MTLSIYDILSELNESNSSNHKLEVLKKHKDNELLQKVLQMTYDTVRFTYGVTVPKIMEFDYDPCNSVLTPGLEHSLESLEKVVATRCVTGHEALKYLRGHIGRLSDQDADVFKKVINRDLRVNFGKTLINKVWKGLITKPVYMRCDTYAEEKVFNPNNYDLRVPKEAKKFDKDKLRLVNFPAFLQLKADGTYREFPVEDGVVKSRSRSGEPYDYPKINETLSTKPDGVYIGELTIRLTAENLETLKEASPDSVEEIQEAFDEGKKVLPRAIGNGIINSDRVPHDDLILDLWDYVTHEEYSQAAMKDRNNPCETPYIRRLQALEGILEDGNDNVKLIEGHLVNNIQEALKYTSGWMSEGLEGAILKDTRGVFKDGTSKHQLKLKLEIDCEMRATAFKEGKVGTKREGKIGSIFFENDEGTIKGYASGFSDKQLDEFSENHDLWMNKVMAVQFNDLSKARGNDYYALSHPRFIEFREDKDETDTLEKVFELREMAMQLGS